MKTMFTKQNLVIALFVLSASLFGIASKGCNEKQLRSSAPLVAVGAQQAVKVERDYFRAGLISPETHEQLAPALENFQTGADEFNKFLKDNPKLSVQSKREAIRLARDLATRLSRLRADGIIKIKDEKKQLAFDLLLSSAESTLALVESLIEQEATAEAAPSAAQQ